MHYYLREYYDVDGEPRVATFIYKVHPECPADEACVKSQHTLNRFGGQHDAHITEVTPRDKNA